MKKGIATIRIEILLVLIFGTGLSHLKAQSIRDPSIHFNHNAYELHQVFEFPIAFMSGEAPFGRTFSEWCKAWVKKVYTQPCADHPMLSNETEESVNEEEGPVVFLFGSVGNTVKRRISISKEKGIFFPVINYVVTYPCPYAGFKPAPGQPLSAFLLQTAADIVNQGTHMTVTLDGMRLTDLGPFRVTTDIFYLEALPELTCLDNCVTGELQPVLTDGYWVMLRPLSPGKHVLQYKGSYTKLGWVVDVTYEILVE
ncbi:MAG TPA: hypothetical protein VFV79_00075 [Saprospiraceae bacterium]|nr:hypothetical protein [Saprospiraceae bacterium]